ncbi:PREDICTED: uncharacterized protein C12orf45 homolog [Ceratotherium simum simum]|uniref:Uncharacterized protein C12orf45 homolog n=1 Tax=Ceratotherium simum simum TaxID=73337 RepID=A0ABM1DM34_CERSS|nr:PREDICTED: uncharacterized protein C12orf45 homolog [Ceratotherium simum simum]
MTHDFCSQTKGTSVGWVRFSFSQTGIKTKAHATLCIPFRRALQNGPCVSRGRREGGGPLRGCDLGRPLAPSQRETGVEAKCKGAVEAPVSLCYSKLNVFVFSGIWDRLLINSKPNSKKNSTLQTVRIERSPLLDQVQSFLPQMAQANEKLRKEIAAAPPGRFNIENIDETLGEVIQMDVALFEMNQSDSKEEDSSEESSQDSSEDGSESEDEDDSSDSEVTIDNIKLPHSEDGKGKIEVLDSPASERKEIVK